MIEKTYRLLSIPFYRYPSTQSIRKVSPSRRLVYIRIRWLLGTSASMCEYENLKDSEQKFNRDLVRTKQILDKSAVCMEFQRF